jgi:hypothetical protein
MLIFPARSCLSKTYAIEWLSTRLRENNSYRKSALDVWSNGSMTRQECLSLVESRDSIQRRPSVSANGIALAQLRKQKRKKGGEIMKNFKANLSMLLVVGVLGTSGAAIAADGAEVEGQLDAGSYCHEKFPAMTERSLSGNQPELKQPTTGDMVDYYGPCNEDPTGKDEIAAQKLEHYHQMSGSRGGEFGRF